MTDFKEWSKFDAVSPQFLVSFARCLTPWSMALRCASSWAKAVRGSRLIGSCHAPCCQAAMSSGANLGGLNALKEGADVPGAALKQGTRLAVR